MSENLYKRTYPLRCDLESRAAEMISCIGVAAIRLRLRNVRCGGAQMMSPESSGAEIRISERPARLYALTEVNVMTGAPHVHSSDL